MKKSNDLVHDVLIAKFDFLAKEHNLTLVFDQINDWGYRLIYKGSNVAVSIVYEYREAYIHILLHRLVNGEIENDPNPYQEDLPLLNIGLDWIVKVLDPSKLVKLTYDGTADFYCKDGAFETMAGNQAANLKNFAGSVLEGDFTVFQEVDALVKEHYR
ncbi:MAG TPA: hypothetical protein VHY08_24410 [Bacillota bacterium]|nr:hypothetical protein [Bacillota bacterium]